MTLNRTLSMREERWALKETFRISRGAKDEAAVIVVEVEEGALRGRGEGVPYGRYGESVDSVLAEIESVRAAVEAGEPTDAILGGMSPGAARNALDCALLELRSLQLEKAPHELLGLPAPAPAPTQTATTLVVDAPERLAEKAASLPPKAFIKIKLDGEHDVAKVAAVRMARPEARLVVDANESWSLQQYVAWVPKLAGLGVELIEQPFSTEGDEALEALSRPIPICADESAHTIADLPRVADRYDAVNIKLDKAGGLIAATAMARQAKEHGLRIMLGCMVSTSLSIAPALLLAPLADWVDLDGAHLLGEDRAGGTRVSAGKLLPPTPGFWGHCTAEP